MESNTGVYSNTIDCEKYLRHLEPCIFGTVAYRASYKWCGVCCTAIAVRGSLHGHVRNVSSVVCVQQIKFNSVPMA